MAAAASPPQAAKVGIQRQYHGCSSIRDYEIQGKLGEGTFGEVHKAKSRKTGQSVALKKILMHNEKDGFPITALREIKLLKLLSHANVLKLEEMAIERPKGEGRKKAITYMVTPYAEHDLSGLLDNPDVRFTEPQIKCYMMQLLEGLRYLHENKILHRDMKAANLLITNRGILQIADFGLARHYEDDPPRPGRGGGEARRDYTALVVTRWYRPPELLLSLRRYTTAIDLWGAGCVFGEMFKRKPILMGNSDLNQAQLIFDLVGSPNDDNMPGWSALPGCEGVKQFGHKTGNLAQVFREQGSLAISLMSQLMKLDWKKRINAMDALKHPYFSTDPLPARPEDLPRFADSHELDRRSTRGQKQALPPAPAGGSVGVGHNGESFGPNGPPPPGVPNGQWSNDRGPPRHGYDRGPPGPPAAMRGPMPHDRGYEHRGPRHQHWQDRAPPPRSQDNRHALPPRPSDGMHPLPNPPPYRGGDIRERHPPGNSKIDTYIPSYNRDRQSKEREELPLPPRDARRGSRDSGDSGRPVSRGEARGRRDEYWDRDRGPPLPREGYDRRATRSRSPDRDRRGDRRERDPYHRR